MGTSIRWGPRVEEETEAALSAARSGRKGREDCVRGLRRREERRRGSAGQTCLGCATLCHPVGSYHLAKKPAALDVMTPDFGDLCFRSP